MEGAWFKVGDKTKGLAAVSSFLPKAAYKWKWSIPKSFVVVVQSLSLFRLFVTPWTAGFPVLHYLPEFAPIQSVMPLTFSSSATPFSCLQSFPASGSFPMSPLFASGGQSIGVSASKPVLPMNVQDWLPFRIDWFDLFAVQGTLKSLLQHHGSKHLFFSTQLSLLSNPHNQTRLLEKP